LFDDIMREVVEENSVVELWIKLETHTWPNPWRVDIYFLDERMYPH
jgi:hypothetical protein